MYTFCFDKDIFRYRMKHLNLSIAFCLYFLASDLRHPFSYIYISTSVFYRENCFCYSKMTLLEYFVSFTVTFLLPLFFSFPSYKLLFSMHELIHISSECLKDHLWHSSLELILGFVAFYIYTSISFSFLIYLFWLCEIPIFLILFLRGIFHFTSVSIIFTDSRINLWAPHGNESHCIYSCASRAVLKCIVTYLFLVLILQDITDNIHITQ